MKLSFAILFFLVLSGAGGSGEPPDVKLPPVREKQDEPTNHEAAATNNATKLQATPYAIIINNPAATQEKYATHKEPEPWPPLWTILAALIITGSASGIALWTLIFIKQQAEAANKTLAFTLRPRLIVRHVHAVSDTSDDENIIHKPFEVSIEVANRGGTPTKIDSGNVAFFVSHKETPEFMQTPVPRKGTEDIFSGISLNPGVEHSFTTTCEPISAQKDLKTALEWRTGLITIYVLGHIWYQDAVGNRYKTAFCRRYDRAKHRFERVDHSDYEYAD